MARLVAALLLFSTAAIAGDECFDETYYLKANPDVAAALQKGEFASGRAHYEAHGKSENRAACAPKPVEGCFDEAFYLKANPDVAAAIQKGEFASAREHYEGHGREEKRLPCPL